MEKTQSKTQKTFIRILRKKYPCIIRWGKYMGSFDYYIDEQITVASDDNAPATAIYKNDDGSWSVAGEITDGELRRKILGK